MNSPKFALLKPAVDSLPPVLLNAAYIVAVEESDTKEDSYVHFMSPENGPKSPIRVSQTVKEVWNLFEKAGF